VYHLNKAVGYKNRMKRSLGFSLLAAILLFIVPAISCVDKLVDETETYYETEYQTQTKTETYTETENVVTQTKKGTEYLLPVVEWSGYNLFAGPAINLTHYYGYQIMPSPHQKNSIKITLAAGAIDDDGVIRVYDLTGLGQIPVIPTTLYPHWGYWSPNQIDWFNDFNAKLKVARVLATMVTSKDALAGTISRYMEFDASGVYEFAVIASTQYYESVDRVQINWEDDIVSPQEVTKEREVSVQVPVQVEKQRTVQKVIQVPIWEIFSSK
jgi:hypothetical protein